MSHRSRVFTAGVVRGKPASFLWKLTRVRESGQRVGGGLTRGLYCWAGAASKLYGWAGAARYLVCPTAVECSLLELCIAAPAHCKAPRVFLREKEKTKKQKQTQRAQHMPRFEYSSSRATAGVHTPQSNDSMRRTGSPSSRSKVVDRCRRGVEALVTPQSKTSNTFAPARAQ